MVLVDTVYQKVLAIANKEQRGYVTPLEFNLLANQAQNEIFEDYFLQMNQAKQAVGNESEYSDIIKTLNEKISLFKTRANALTQVGLFFEYPRDMHKLGTVWYAQNNLLENGVEVQEITEDELLDYYQSPLTKPNRSRPLFVRREEGIRIFSEIAIVSGVSCSYIKKPTKVHWGYVVTPGVTGTAGEALYNANASNDFDLHASEESSLVMKILGLAGIVIQRPDLAGIGAKE
tara:strand:+ start:237 stop:932 length:696 start_codon:yes stop_codon:yes gene_type:complete